MESLNLLQTKRTAGLDGEKERTYLTAYKGGRYNRERRATGNIILFEIAKSRPIGTRMANFKMVNW